MTSLTASLLDDFHLDILGQQPLLRIYTQISLIYPLQDDSQQQRIIEKLKHGLERLSESFPWVTGQVLGEEVSDGNTGVFKIKPLANVPRLVVKDYRDDPNVPSYDDFKNAGFPSRMLDESLVAPKNTLPTTEDLQTESPVFLMQASFIKAGLILTFNGQHQTMDMTGQSQVTYLLSQACEDKPFTSAELESGNLARRSLIPYLEESYTPGAELEFQIVKRPKEGDSTPSSPSKSTWTYFAFSASSLSTLKTRATESLPAGSSFISTDDALSAYIWQAVARARLPRIGSDATSTFARAVDARRYLNVPASYTGLCQNMAYKKLKIKDLSEAPLGVIAAQLRAAVDPDTSDVAYRTRALATYMHRSPDKKDSNFGAAVDLSTDLMLSSWAKFDCYSLEFGLGLGKPVSVRRPSFAPFPSLLYLMPKALNGEIVLMICLRDEDLGRLREDEDFTNHGKEIG